VTFSICNHRFSSLVTSIPQIVRHEQKKKDCLRQSLSLSKNFAGMRNEIGRGGVHGATAAIFPEENSIF